MRFASSLVAVHCLVAVLTVSADDSVTEAEQVTCQVDVNGIAAALLSKGTVEWYFARSERLVRYRMAEFPVVGMAIDRDPAFLSFYDAQSSRVAAVITTSPIAARHSERVTISLGKPLLETRITRLGDSIQVHHLARIADHMFYAAIPRWDAKSNRLTSAESPNLEIVIEPELKPLFVGQMKSGCMGYGWVANPTILQHTGRMTRLRIRVTHDTGDLFGELHDTVEWRSDGGQADQSSRAK